MRRFLAAVLFLFLAAVPARALEEPKYVALTFDDGPAGKYTQMLLDGLYDRGVQATFLLCGYRIRQYPELAERIFRDGHEIGCHGYSHENMKTMSRRQIAAEIMDTQALLPEDCDIAFLRPPGGCCSDAVRQVAEARNLAILNWSVDPRDWATTDTAAIERHVLGRIRDGDIVLLHDMSESSVRAALDIVDVLLKENYRVVTVSELAQIRRVTLKPGQVYKRFPRQEEALK